MGVTQELVDFAYQRNFNDLPHEAVSHLKLITVNILGTVLGGITTCPAEVWLGYAEMVGGRETCTIWGTGQRSSLPVAAFVNGQLSQELDFDEGFTGPFMYASHPEPVLVPTALVTSEISKVSGREGYLLRLEILTR
jgi:2-methylcitrate dehydratase PrpD